MRKLSVRACRAWFVAVMTLAACGDGRSADVDPSPEAFAGIRDLLGPWQATPFLPDPELVAAADAACRAFHRDPLGSLVLADARGGGVIELFYSEGQRTFMECTQMRISETGEVTAQGGGGSGTSERQPAPAAFELVRVGGGHSTGRNGEPLLATASGRAGPGLARVEIHAKGQPPVVATLANGWFAGWWPGPPGGTAIGFDFGGAAVTRLALE